MIKKTKFHYLKAENAYCFGTPGIEIYFDNYGNIVNIHGKNVDVFPPRSNGTGKTESIGVLVYGLFGKALKSAEKIKHGDIINNKIKKKLYIEVQWDNCRVVRTRKPDSLRFWKSDERVWVDAGLPGSNEKTLGTSKATQELIEQELGINYETFVNVVIFDDDSENSFLKSTPAQKRIIAENLLSLEKYREYNDVVKDLKKELKDNIKLLLVECQKISDNGVSIEKRINNIKQQESTWINTEKNELQKLISRIKSKKNELENSDDGEALILWQEAQDKLNKISVDKKQNLDKKSKIEDLSQKVKDEINSIKEKKHKSELTLSSYQEKIKQIKAKINEENNFIKELFSNKGTRCNKCFGVVEEENCNHATLAAHNKIEEFQTEIQNQETTTKECESKIENYKNTIIKITEQLNVINQKQKEVENIIFDLEREYTNYSKITRPQANSNALLIEQQISELKKQAIEKKSVIDKNKSPYSEILEEANEELKNNKIIYDQKSKEAEDLNDLMLYYDYFSDAFGDSGIRKIIIDDIVPALNESLSYWVNPLMSGQISIKFDNELNETIERNPPNGDPYVYNCMSKGQQKILNLCVSQAFAYVMMLSWGTIPSFIYLDEIGSNMDEYARQNIYNMILELSKERQVFITTHDKSLQELLLGNSEINLEQKDGFTTVKNN